MPLHKNKAVMETLEDGDEKELMELKKIDAKIEVGLEDSLLSQLRVWFVLRDKVLEVQRRDVEVDKMRNKVELGVDTPFFISKDGMVIMDRQIYLLEDKTLKEEALREASESRFVVHLESTKMYKYLKEFY